MTAPLPERPRRLAGLALVLVALVGILYARTARHAFLSYDDGSYLTENPGVRDGLSWDGVRWAFTAFHSANWHPLTWLSHQLDVTLFGLEPGPHHLVNAALHALNAVLCLVWLARATGAPLASFLVALLFAVHPLRVESVAWASERKDVLSGTFFFLTLLAWSHWAERPGARRMALVVAAFALGLLAKPMLVTVPLVLLLVDAWPLGRWAGAAAAPRSSSAAPSPAPTHPGETSGAQRGFARVAEKWALLALALASALLTVLAQRAGGALRSVEVLSIPDRIATALVGTATYVRQSFWPSGLAFFYPHPAFVDRAAFSLVAPRVLVSAGALALLAGLAVVLGRRTRAVPVGLAWMAVMLLPVVGLVQVGAQLHADRYAYLPTLGPTFAIVFGLHALAPAWRRTGFVVGLAAAGALAVVTWRQVGTWRDMRSLCERALAVTDRNYVALEHLGLIEQRAGNLDAARRAYEATLAIAPNLHDAHSNLGAVDMAQGRPEEAVEHFRRALALSPGFLDARLNWGLLEEGRGDWSAAREQYERAVAEHPESRDARRKLGDAALALGDAHAAVQAYGAAVQLGGGADELAGLGWAQLEAGRLDEARTTLGEALARSPDHAPATHLLAYLEAVARDPRLRDPTTAAQRLARCDPAVARTSWQHARAVAAVLAAQGRSDEAARQAAEALARAPSFAWAVLKAERETYLAGRALERP